MKAIDEYVHDLSAEAYEALRGIQPRAAAVKKCSNSEFFRFYPTSEGAILREALNLCVKKGYSKVDYCLDGSFATVYDIPGEIPELSAPVEPDGTLLACLRVFEKCRALPLKAKE